MRLVRCQLLFSILCFFFLASSVDSSRIKDITKLQGVRDNQLIGYGLVVGLDGTGDKTAVAPFTDQSFQNMLLEFGIHLPPGRPSQLKNIAAVAISAKLPPFARIGQKLDVTISSIGNATSLRGGSLLLAPLRGADGRVYAMCQGSVVVSGFGVQGSDGSKVTVNSVSSGSIPNGATVEKTIDMPFVQNGAITLELLRPDFTTAVLIERAINQHFRRRLAQAIDASAVVVQIDLLRSLKEEIIPMNEQLEKLRYVPIIARIENIQVTPAEVGARVIANSRTGTIVIGSNVTISPVAVTHGNLSVIVTERPYVSQPNAFANGHTVTGKASDINVSQQQNRMFLFAPGPSLNDLVTAIDAVGAAPGDLIAILEAIKAAGALNADLEVI